MAHVCGVFAGKPKRIEDARGVWVSLIYRDPVCVPIRVGLRGLEGDEVADKKHHGSPDQALCVHLTDHYRFWNTKYGMNLQAGGVGENLTIDGITEDEICAGDIARIGTALVQVSMPRVPCSTQARRVGRSDWVKLTIAENRTGFYLRVLEAGVVETGDPFRLDERIHTEAPITALNRCAYDNFDADFARRILEMRGVGGQWKQKMRKRLAEREETFTRRVGRPRDPHADAG